MDIRAIIAKESTGASVQNQQSGEAVSLGGLPVSFADLMKGGVSFDIGINALADRTELAHVAEPGNQPASADDEGAQDSLADRSSGAERNNGNSESYRSDRHDDYGRDQTAERGSDGGNEQDTSRADNGDGRQPRQDDSSRDDGQDAGPSSAEDNASADGTADTDNEASSETPAANGETADSGVENNANADATDGIQAAFAKQNAEQVLAGLVAAAQDGSLPRQVSDQAQANNASAGQRENAIEGLAKAMAATGKETSAQGGNAGNASANAHGQQTQANSNTQAQANINAQAQAGAEAAAKATSTASQQAADLAKIVGEGNRISLSVDVANKAETLVSKPNASLTSSTALAGEGGKSQHGGQSLLNHGAAGMSQAAQQVAQQGAAGTGQAQQAQALASSGPNAAGSAPGALQANAGIQQPQAVGGEAQASANPNGTAETQQSQQNAAAKAAAAARPFNLPRQAIVDQVTVQITKAINSGADKINIQLKPASLGRVDVQLEVGHDGRTIAVITADNKDTLDLLQKDSKDLEQALKDAGLQMDQDSLNFNLREQEEQADEDAGAGLADSGRGEDEYEDDDLMAAKYRYGDGIVTDTKIDIRA